MDTRILQTDVTFSRQPFKTPLILSTGEISDLIEVEAQVRVAVNGRQATGRGSIYLSDLWAWPDPAISHEQKETVLRALCEEIAHHLVEYTGGAPAHPLELGLRLSKRVCHADDANSSGDAAGRVPILAQAMCLSPFDAAIHDAVGIALERSAFDLYENVAPIPSADDLFEGGGACAAINRMCSRTPKRELPAWLIVGKNDDLEKTVRPWAVDRRYRCFKLKIMGKDNEQDAARTVEVYQAARGWGVTNPWLSVDSNEGNPDAASVLDYLHRVREADAGAFAALQYLEQPTGRNILEHTYDWRKVSQLKPVMLDEGLTDLALLPEAVAQAWSGLALKTCKGHSFAMVAAAWGQARGLKLSLQDLTNPGYSFIHGALMAAHLPTINGVELNSPQFTPAANEPWLPRLAELFEPKDGVHRLPPGPIRGLGSTL